MEFPFVLTLKDGKNETLLSLRDFEYLIDKHMGFESLKFFRVIEDRFTDLDDDRRKAEDEYDKLYDDHQQLKKLNDHLRQQIRELGGEPD